MSDKETTGFFCDKCNQEIHSYVSDNRKILIANLLQKICDLEFSNFRERTASGGRRYSAKIGKHEICLFIDTCDNARIMVEGKGNPWLASVDFKNKTDEQAFVALQAIIKKDL